MSRARPGAKTRAMPKSISLILPSACDHDVGGLEVAEDDRRALHVQIVQRRAELLRPAHHLGLRQRPLRVDQALLHRLPVDELHHEVVARALEEMRVDTRQVGMAQPHEGIRLEAESVERLLDFLRREAVLAHLLDGDGLVVARVGRLIDGGHATLADLLADQIAPGEAALQGEAAGGVLWSRRAGLGGRLWRWRGRALQRATAVIAVGGVRTILRPAIWTGDHPRSLARKYPVRVASPRRDISPSSITSAATARLQRQALVHRQRRLCGHSIAATAGRSHWPIRQGNSHAFSMRLCDGLQRIRAFQ